MKFTGERFIPTEQGKIRLEHYHRYAIVLNAVKGKEVLDVACGEGYGSFCLADVASSVVGVDISDEAVSHAMAQYKKSNLSFSQGSASALDFPDQSFDVVVSFETLEHLHEQQEMIDEIRRVLRSDGVLIISSPNRPIYSEESGEHNEFHVKELDFQEFDELLKTRFGAIRYLGQRMQMGSVIQPLEGTQNKIDVYSDDGKTIRAQSGSLKAPVYYLAVCAEKKSDIPELGMSCIFPDDLDLIQHYVGFAKWAKIQGERIEIQGARIEKILLENAEAIERSTKLQAEVTGLQQEIARIKQSTSWKITLPLRELMRWMNSPRSQVSRYFRMTLRQGKRLYQAIPLSYETKAMHRQWLAKYVPRLLLGSGSPSSSIPALRIPEIFVRREYFEAGAPLNACAASLEFPVYAGPLVSVIIPVYGQITYTLRCLASILGNLPFVPFEVIVVDDCSPDDSLAVLENVKGIVLVRNETNQGFIRSCNNGARVAQGELLHFLNNDTEVLPGWMDELLRTFEMFPGTGLAGSKLIYPDGRLQEAGGIIWRDGSAWNFGRFKDPLDPVYDYAREVDYCSGASIMVPRQVFETLGGFDEHYLPAYCEDADLALKIRDKGLRVIYQPRSMVVHYEGVTSGCDLTQGAKAYQIENTRKLFDRWQVRLSKHQQPGADVERAKDRRAKYHALVLDHCTPTPNQDAGSVTVFNMLLLLREMSFQVTFIPEDNFLYMPEYTNALQRAGVEVLYAPYVTSVYQHLREHGKRYDLALLFRPGVVERHLQTIRAFSPNAKVLFHTVDLHFLRMQREAELNNDHAQQMVAKEMQQRELAAIRTVDASIVHSTAEMEILLPMLGEEKLYVFPLIMNVLGTETPFSQRRDLIFVGGYQHAPNVDAVRYFAKDIMPLLRKRLPGVRFFAVGSNPPPDVQELSGEDIVITGFVENLDPLLQQMKVSIAPLRYGAGIKGKVGTSMAAGLPVVGTTLAAEGMLLKDGENILLADDAAAFVEAIAKVYEDEVLWNRLSRNGIEFSEKTWGGEAACNILSTILSALGFNIQRGPYPLSLYTESHKGGQRVLPLVEREDESSADVAANLLVNA